MPRSTTWNDANVYTLKKLWAAGVTSDVIAVRIGITRNAVVGKIHRLGLSHDSAVAAARTKAGGLIGPGSQKFRTGNPGRGGNFNKVNRTRKAANAERDKAKVATLPAQVKTAIVPPDDPGVYATARKPLRELAANECKWPIGDPQDKRFGFCADARVPGKPYCAGHCAIAYVSPEVARREAAERRTERAGEVRRRTEEVA